MSLQAKLLKRFLKFVFNRLPPDIEGQREFVEKYATQPKRSMGVVTESINAGGVPAEWITLPGVDEDKVLFHLHGGAYVFGSVNSQRNLIAHLAKAGGVRAFAPDFRLAPEHPFPAPLEDVLAAYRWLLSTGIDPENIIMSGDSSGGGLALGALVSLRDAGDPLPVGVVLLSPWTDLAGTGDSMKTKADVDVVCKPDVMIVNAKNYAGGYDLKHPLISPMYADLTGLPPMLIHVGEDEVMLDDSTRLAERAKETGVDVTLEVWKGMMHIFPMYVGVIPESKKSISEIGAFIQKLVG